MSSAAGHPLELLVRNLESHIALDDADREAILALPHKVRTLEAATYTVREGDPPQRCCVLITGYAFRQKLSGDGSRQILSIHIPGEALDFQNIYLEVSDHSVQML